LTKKFEFSDCLGLTEKFEFFFSKMDSTEGKEAQSCGVIWGFKSSTICIGVTFFAVKAVVVQRDVRGVAATDVLLDRPYNFAEAPLTT
jgi:hypothetical protein